MIIHKFITHVLNKDMDEPVLNDFEGKVSPVVDKFLQQSIKKVKKDDFLRKAKFKDYDENLIKNLCDEIIYNEKSFVESSKEIASFLFDTMKCNLGIDSGDLVVCLFTEKDQKYVAIVKLDYKKVYNHSIEYEDDKFNIQIKQNEIGIAETFKPRQAAIVGVNGINDEYDLLVIDAEAEKKRDKSSFIDLFIKGEKVIDDTYKTARFIGATVGYINNAFDSLSEKHETFNLFTHMMLNTSAVSINDIADKLFKDTEVKNGFIKYLEKNNITNFNIDKRIATKRLNRIELSTLGFKFRVKLEDLNNEKLLKIVEREDGKYDLVLKDVGCMGMGIGN